MVQIRFWFFADDVCILGGSVHTINKNAEALMLASKEIGLEVNSDKTKYMVMSPDQSAGRSHNIKSDNSSFERVGQLQYLGKTLISTEEEIKRRLKSVNACYHPVQNLLSSTLLSKSTHIKIYRTIIVPVFCMGLKLGR